MNTMEDGKKNIKKTQVVKKTKARKTDRTPISPILKKTPTPISPILKKTPTPISPILKKTPTLKPQLNKPQLNKPQLNKPQLNMGKLIIEETKRNLLYFDPNKLIAAFKLLHLDHGDMGKNVEQRLSENEIIAELMKPISNTEYILLHDEYVKGLDAVSAQTLTFYQGMGYVPMNSYLRTGKIPVSFEECIKKLSTSKVEVAPGDIARNAIKEVKKILDQNEIIDECLEKVLNQNKIHASYVVAATARLLKIIKEAMPKISKDIWVFRGEVSYTKEPKFSSKAEMSTHELQQLNLKEGQVYEALGFNSFTMAPWIAVEFETLAPCCIYRMKLNSNIPYFVYPPSNMKEFEVLLPPSKFRVDKIHYLHSDYSQDIRIKVYDISWVSTVSSNPS
jgi:hypothetical protein